MTDNKYFDAIIIGGSYAGLSAAMALGRSLRTVLIIDSGLPCNRQTPHSHNFLTQDGEKPAAIAAKAKEQVLQYETVKFFKGGAIKGKINDKSFTITTTEGEEFNARKLLFATGIKDILPDIKGFAESWGISLIHCPYCHGYEFRGKKTGIMANGDKAFHLASLVKNLTQEVTILTSGKSLFTPEQSEKLQEHAISVVETEVEEVHHKNGFIEHFSFTNGSQLTFDAVYAAVPFQQHSDIPASLGCELTEHGYIKVDHLQKTTIPGVFACGDNSMMLRSVASAVAGGNLAGAMVNMELTHESF